ncbi:menaquinone biosynthetic enzyme MqnA/MqnD family protein [Cohnella hashimotonis]|uniref:Chorismate dehydratase n=1 Tax=Cohnella hashimotonis TaxID=2826895 RepID=A0ABT6TGQ5_9BACL|nr:menaquinone biosynthesis protein [Cohnella hashimotonis]MDI4645488.1 menaquinone biosynthesis protein [Cohnella hashimotonis]
MNHDRTEPIRIGRIDYTNVWPVFHHFEPELLRCAPRLVRAMPAELNRRLREGAIDMAAISSFAYGLNSEDYVLLPNLSVSARGPVQSILLFLKSPLETVLDGGRIAMTTTSATSVNLLKILMEKFHGGQPVYESAEPDLDSMLTHADAALLIGDHAIRASWHHHGYEVIDLSESWYRFTGMWMTFAVWAVRREAAAAMSADIAEIYEALVDSKRRSYGDMRPVIDHALRTVGGTEAYWKGYFEGLNHDFGSGQREGLSLFFKYARELGYLEKDVAIEEWSLAGPVATPAAPPQ